jgi:hypothetical protein
MRREYYRSRTARSFNSVETLWSDMKAIEGFAGPDKEAAVVAKEAVHLLTSYDHRVRHYHVDLREPS